MKLLLTQQFSANELRTPIALMDLAVYGRAFGHQIDLAYVNQVGKLDDYDIVGLSALSLGYHVLSAVKSLRENYSGRIVFGGKAASSLQPAEHVYLDQLGVEVHAGPGETLLSDVPIDYENYPAWQEADFRILDRGATMTEMMSSRGCPYRCNFCHNTEKKVEYFSIERIMANASLILNTIGRPRVFFVDDVFAVRAERLHAILDASRQNGVDLQGRCCFFVHINHTNDETIEAIGAYDPREVLVGIESGDNRMLEAMGKRFTAERAEEQLRKLHSRGIRAAGLFLMGFPGETKESLQATVDFVDRNRKYMSGWWVSYYQPVPFTKGWEIAKERVGDDMVTGGWNTEINYIDPNVAIKDLRKARWAAMGY